MTKATSSIVDPGACASSSTLDINDVGRLSITNQPRSSSTSATRGTPGAGQPRDDDEVGHPDECTGGIRPSR